jgi:hypothetical protein
MATMTNETTPAVWLEGATRARAWSARTRAGFAAAVLVGGLPAVLFVGLMRPEGFADLPLVATMFILGPTLASVAWSMIDRPSTDARELLMWLTAISKTRSQRLLPDQANEAIDAALAEAAALVSRGAEPSEVSSVLRSAVRNHFHTQRRLAVYVAYAWFAPAILWLAFAAVSPKAAV